jgi:uncharacterized membrane protein
MKDRLRVSKMPLISTVRLESFSDAVIAVIITILVLEMKVPHGADLAALLPIIPVFLAYILSFVVIGIFWNNHHHLLRNAKSLTPGIMWANLVLLFWLSLLPFFTSWLGENYFHPLPTAFYGGVLLLASIAYFFLQQAIITGQGKDSALAQAVGNDMKGKLSITMYALAIGLAFIDYRLADGLYILVAIIWLIPDHRLVRVAQRH